MISRTRGTALSRIASGLLILLGSLLAGSAISDDPFIGGEPGFGATQRAVLALGIAVGGCALLPLPWRLRTLALIATTLASLGAVELALERLLGPRYWPPVARDEKCIFKPRPGGVGDFVHLPINGGARVRYRINRDGFRGEELRPADGHPRVMVYGDSFIQAIYTRTESTLCADLERDLGAGLSAPVEVINAGVAGYGPDQVLLKMEDELPRYRPDLAVVAIYAGNDFGDLERDKLFRPGPDGGLVPNRYRLSREMEKGFALSRKEAILKVLIRDWWSRPRGGGPRTIATPLRAALEEHEDFARGSDTVTNLGVDDYNADVSLMPESESARSRVRFMEAVLARIRDTAARDSVPLVLMFIPNPSDVCDGYDGYRVDRAEFPDYRPENLTKALAGIAERNHIEYLDLFGVFRPLDGNKLYYHGGDDHWNDEGQRVAARALCDFIIRRRLLRPGAGAAPGPSDPDRS